MHTQRESQIQLYAHVSGITSKSYLQVGEWSRRSHPEFYPSAPVNHSKTHIRQPSDENPGLGNVVVCSC